MGAPTKLAILKWSIKKYQIHTKVNNTPILQIELDFYLSNHGEYTIHQTKWQALLMMRQKKDEFTKYTNITGVNLSVFVYRLFNEYFSPIVENLFRRLERNLLETVCKQNTDKITFVILVYKALHWALYHVWFQNRPELYEFTKYT